MPRRIRGIASICTGVGSTMPAAGRAPCAPYAGSLSGIASSHHCKHLCISSVIPAAFCVQAKLIEPQDASLEQTAPLSCGPSLADGTTYRPDWSSRRPRWRQCLSGARLTCSQCLLQAASCRVSCLLAQPAASSWRALREQRACCGAKRGIIIISISSEKTPRYVQQPYSALCHAYMHACLRIGCTCRYSGKRHGGLMKARN